MDDDFDFGDSTQGGEAEFEAMNDAPQATEDDENLFAAPPEPSPPAHTMPRRVSSDAPMPTKSPSEATNKWKSENEKKIRERDAEFAKLKKEFTKKSEETLEKLKSERAKKIAATAKANREAQTKADAAMNTKSNPSGPISWTKFAQLVDLEKDTADRERMRSVLKTKIAESKA